MIWKPTLLILVVSFPLMTTAKTDSEGGYLRGQINLDSSWEDKIYLCYIPTFEAVHTIANDMIIAEASIDSLGSFSFDLSFLPEQTNLFRLHLVKRGNSPNSLIIGGQDENHLLLLANRNMPIDLEGQLAAPPFKKVYFKAGTPNTPFHRITKLVNRTYEQANRSTAARRQFMETQLFHQLRSIADSSQHPLISLYAIYQSGFPENWTENADYFHAYRQKWAQERSPYFSAFRQKMPAPKPFLRTGLLIIGGICLLTLGFFLGKKGQPHSNPGLQKLTVQERKIYSMLRNGQTNQEISDACHIGISTVKSHVSSIYRKLNVKSRKEVMNL